MRLLSVFVFLITSFDAYAETQANSREQQILARYTGSWSIQFDADDAFSTGTSRAFWVLNQTYVERIATFKARFVSHDLSVKSLTSYDREKNRFVRWYFPSNGRTFQAFGIWDGEKKTMTWESKQLEPRSKATIHTTTTERFLADGRIERVSISKDADRIVGQSTTMLKSVEDKRAELKQP